jgi:hypothetical protein
VDRSRYPAITALREELTALTDQDVFTTGVEVILAVAADAAGRHADRTP